MKLSKLMVGAMAAMAAMATQAAPKCNVPMTISGYAGTATLTDFPVLVRLSESIVGFKYADCAADGRDIAFVDANGAAIPHEIDVWNTSGESLVWVKLPTMANGTTFTMTYKDAAAEAPSAADKAATWSAYGMVWHMSEPSNTVANATAYGSAYDATPKGASAGVAVSDGVFGPGRKTSTKTGTGVGYLSVPSYNALGYKGVFTMSGWMRMTNYSGCMRPFSRKTSWASGDGWESEIEKGYTTFKARGASSAGPTCTFPSFLNTWVHIALVYNGTNLKVYGNGAKLGEGTIVTATDNGKPLSIGCNSDGTEGTICGDFDECRLRGGAMSADWVAAEYAQASTGFVTFGEAGSPGLTIRGDVGDYGTATPTWGRTSDYTEGDTIACSVTSPTITEDGNTKAVCTGWTYVDGDDNETSGSGNATTITYSIGSKLTWHFDLYNKFSVTSGNPDWGTVAYDEKASDGTWVKRGGSCEVTATPTSDDYAFIGWTGDVDDAHKRDNPFTVVVTNTPMTVTAVFDEKYSVKSIDLSQGDVTLTVNYGCVCRIDAITTNNAAALTFTGGGTVYLPEDDLSDGFASLVVDGVTIYAKDGSSLGAGGVLIRNNGGIIFSEAFTLANKITIESGSKGFLSFAEGTTTVDVGKLVTAGATFTKFGPGVMKSNGHLTGAAIVGNSRWIFEAGELIVYAEKWGQSSFYVEMHEGTVLRRTYYVYHLSIGNIVLRGAKFLHEMPLNSVGGDMLHVASAHNAPGIFGLQVLAAKDGTPSYVSIDLGFSSYGTLNVDVAENAVLDYNCNLRGNGSAPLVALKKTGKGKMRLLKAPYDRTSIKVTDGTLALSGPNTRIGRNTALVLGENAKIELENGAVLDSIGVAESALLAEAQLHVDATTITNEYTDGQWLPSILNRGATGGAFSYTSPASAPSLKYDSFNGKPAFACNSTPSHGMGLACVDATPNKGSEISIYYVANPKTDLFTFTGTSTGLNSTPVCMTSDSGKPNSEGAFRYEYKSENKFSIYFQGNGTPLTIEDEAVALSKGPFIESLRRDATTASFSRWFGEGDEYTASLADQKFANFNINNFAFMAYMTGRGNTWNYNTCPMDMCEILVFDRKLTDAEDAAVRGYLAKKWFDSTAEWPALPKTESVKEVPVCVPAGETGVLAAELAEDVVGLKVVKTGAGTLVDMGATDNGTEIVVEEGALKYAKAESGEISAAAIWFDAADNDAVTVSEEGVVTSVKNKGWAGGTFTPNATATTGTPTLGAINGVQAVKFDGKDDFLRIASFTNATPRQLYVYLVNQRDAYVQNKGGVYFSLSKIASPYNDSDQAGAVVAADANSIEHTIDVGSVKSTYGNFYNAYPAIDYYMVGDYTVSYGQVNSNCLYTSVVQQRNMHGNSPSDADRATVNDLFQLGARRNKNDAPGEFFNGKIGEVVVLEQPLNIDQLIELMDYFRAKWMEGPGSKEPPTWLAGRKGATGKNRTVVQKAATALVQNGPTVALKSLTMEEGTTLARTTKCTGEALFNVTGKLTTEGPVNVELTPFPHGAQTLFTYGTGDVSGDVAAWPALRKTGYATGLVRQNVAENLIWICGPGLLFIVK